MSKKLFTPIAFALLSTGYCFAQTAAPVAPPENPHKAYDQKVSACRIQAANSGLTGDALTAFIAQCVYNK